jgi:hypothetical protein
MGNRPSLDGLRDRLRRRGLPAEYVRRLIREWEDHLEDLLMEKEEAMSKEALRERIGTTEELAEAAVSEYRKRTVFGRHPVLTFVVGPVPLMVLGWASFLLGAFALFKGLHLVLGSSFDVAGKPVSQWPPLMVWLAGALHGAGRFVPPAVAALVFWRLASRGGLSWRWPLAACAIVALLAGMYTSQMDLPVQAGQGRLMIGLGLAWVPSARQLAQLAVPAAIGLVSAWRLAAGGRKENLASC